MMNEVILKKTIIQHLIETYGNVETERFIASIIKEPFDYTKWRQNQFNDVEVKDLFVELRAMENAE
jgi:hypothetical protein